MKKWAYRLAVVLMAVIFSCLLLACESNDPLNPKTYQFGKDKVASIISVVGERTVTNVESQGKNEFPSKQYTYRSDSVSDDLTQYIQFLQDAGWTMAGASYDLETPPGMAQFVKESVDEGQILTLRIDYEETQYTIKITKAEALINPS